MSFRCPDAKAIGTTLLKDHQLVFRHYADYIYLKGSTLSLGLWKITSKCEKSLDRYEGYPNFYEKHYWTITDGKSKVPALIYQMSKSHRYYDPDFSYPTPTYLGSLKSGYRDFNLDHSHLSVALKLTTKNIKKSNNI